MFRRALPAVCDNAAEALRLRQAVATFDRGLAVGRNQAARGEVLEMGEHRKPRRL